MFETLVVGLLALICLFVWRIWRHVANARHEEWLRQQWARGSSFREKE